MNEIKQSEKGERITIRTVARDAGVSVAAVSKVLRNAYGVSENLRQKVMESIERLGYRPSIAARGMRGQTYTIGILLVEIANPFLPPVIDGMNEILLPSSYKAMFGVGQANQPMESSLIESMIDNHMDGLILIAPRITDDVISRYAQQVPIAVIGHHSNNTLGFDTINGNDRAGAAVAVGAMIEAGHVNIAMVIPDFQEEDEAGVIVHREKGYLDAMSGAGLASESRIIRIANTGVERDSQIIALLQSADRPKAIFCWSDLHGVHLVSHAKNLGLRLPEDLAVVAYDNSPIAALPSIGLSSMDQGASILGRTAAELLLSRIDGRSAAEHVVIQPTLVRRTSF